MGNNSLLNKLFEISPYIEIFVRKLYWKNIRLFSRYQKRIRKINSSRKLKDFDKILHYLDSEGIGKGNLMILHSSFESIEGTSLSPKQIIQKLLLFLGEEGTLAMNAARTFKNKIESDYLTQDYSNVITYYDTKKSKVWTGALPLFLIRHPHVEISEFPLNSMAAVGKLAKQMMKNNLDGNLTACGEGSSWQFCVENNAIVVGIGIDLTHSLTIMHVAEDANNNWPITGWYRERIFSINSGGNKKEVTVLERKPKWGTLHFAERTLYKDLVKNKILISTTIDGVQVEYLYARQLIDFLNNKNTNGYPYFGIGKKIKHEASTS